MPPNPLIFFCSSIKAITGWDEKVGELLEAPSLEIKLDDESRWRFGYKVSAHFTHKAEGWTMWIDAVTGELVSVSPE